jgi:hypothetical protein
MEETQSLIIILLNILLPNHFSNLFKVEKYHLFQQKKKEKEKAIVASFFMVFDIVICKLVQFQGA